MTITIIGHGYVGLVTACVFADLGNVVYVIGRSRDKIKLLNQGDPIIYEPGLRELLVKNIKAERLIFTTEYKEAIFNSQIIFIAVGTPPKENGVADLTSVYSVAESIGNYLSQSYTVIACKSTVPLGTNKEIRKIIDRKKTKNITFDVASCPEFLREGSAIQDMFYPDRIVIGTNSLKAKNLLLKLHKPLGGQRICVSLESAELIKYSSNAILSVKISFANLISFICEKTGANVEEVLLGIGLDHRIGTHFLKPGLGYGGSCFPKDIKALIHSGTQIDVNMLLLEAVDSINEKARELFTQKILKHCPGKNIAIWGLSFKPNTDDIRFAPAIYVIKQLLKKGYSITVYDPEALENTRAVLKQKIKYAKNPYSAIEGADCLVICTEWNEFIQIDIDKIKKSLKSPCIIDGRNIYDPTLMQSKGFTYISVGR